MNSKIQSSVNGQIIVYTLFLHNIHTVLVFIFISTKFQGFKFLDQFWEYLRSNFCFLIFQANVEKVYMYMYLCGLKFA